VRKEYDCACRTAWIVDFGDDRGIAPTDSLTAALASGLLMPVRLGQVSKTPMRPIMIQGVCYGSGKPTNLCPACGNLTKRKA
jgi:hypothetical protein